MIGSCTPRKLETSSYAQEFPGDWQGPFSSLPSSEVAWSPPPAPLPPVLCPQPSPPRTRTKPSGSDWEGSRRRDRGMGKGCTKEFLTPSPLAASSGGEQRANLLSRSLAPIWLGSGHRASSGLPRGPTLLPVGGNSDTCLISRLSQGLPEGGGRLLGEELGSRAAHSLSTRCEGPGKAGCGNRWEPGSEDLRKPPGMESRGSGSTPLKFLAPGLSDWPDLGPIFQAALEGGRTLEIWGTGVYNGAQDRLR